MKNGTGQKLPQARKDDVVVEELPDEVIVFDWRSKKAHCLNQTAAMVLKHCDGRTTVPEIARRMRQELKTPVKEDVVWLALDGLGKSDLLQERLGSASGAHRVSRREAMRLGVAGAFALPLVTSILAPAASEAATCIPQRQGTPGCKNNGNNIFGQCTQATECCSCCCNPDSGDPSNAHCTAAGQHPANECNGPV